MASTAAACGSGGAGTAGTGHVQVVASFYPLAEVAQRVGGRDVTVTNLTPGRGGWANSTTPLQVYAHFRPARDAELARQLATKLDEQGSEGPGWPAGAYPGEPMAVAGLPVAEMPGSRLRAPCAVRGWRWWILG